MSECGSHHKRKYFCTMRKFSIKSNKFNSILPQEKNIYFCIVDILLKQLTVRGRQGKAKKNNIVVSPCRYFLRIYSKLLYFSSFIFARQFKLIQDKNEIPFKPFLSGVSDLLIIDLISFFKEYFSLLEHCRLAPLEQNKLSPRQ